MNPVSYTHLDVYKRQIQDRGKEQRLFQRLVRVGCQAEAGSQAAGEQAHVRPALFGVPHHGPKLGYADLYPARRRLCLLYTSRCV